MRSSHIFSTLTQLYISHKYTTNYHSRSHFLHWQWVANMDTYKHMHPSLIVAQRRHLEHRSVSILSLSSVPPVIGHFLDQWIHFHDDVIKWKIFRVTGPLSGEFTGHRWIPRKGPLMFSLICAWIDGWVNNHEAGNLRRHRAYYDVIVMCAFSRYILQTKWRFLPADS